MRDTIRWGLMLTLALGVGCTKDLDGDGSAADIDCDDGDASIYPGAPDPCDDVDNDCDDLIDEDEAQIWYPDLDQDGYGDDEAAVAACVAPEGMIAVGGDCDDSDAEINPTNIWYPDNDNDNLGDDAGATETCDPPVGWDQVGGDCDDNDREVYETRRWYPDLDDDGYGDRSADAVEVCEPPGDEYVLNREDCDDERADVHPYAEEVCDLSDNDCDYEVDEGHEKVLLYRDSDGDGYGNPYGDLESCLPEVEGYVDNDLDCMDYDEDVNPDWTEFSTTHRGDGSFDFNCDGEEELEYPESGRCTYDGEACQLTSGFRGGPAECGHKDDFVVDCIKIGPSTCDVETETAQQACR